MRAVFRRTLVSTALVFGSLVAGSPLALAQDKPKAEVMHWWTSGGESAAVKVFAEQYNKAGGEWVDTAIADGTNARAAAINRIVGGNPPTASQFNTGKQFDDLVAQGLLNNLDGVAAEGKWTSFLPPAFVDAITRDGHIYAVPVNVHGQNWMFWSKGVLDKAGVARAAEDLGRVLRRRSTRSRPPASSRSPSAASPGRSGRCSTRCCSRPTRTST